ncbi:RdgB/HAM1 family non-canonical purine NTP pyrophosphatase [Harryflintia acetispora]|uniref:RdgB/HAM1 family non-canonical purine NTP pyrophosphatase n=1 Tax=Harryflintia acetispora TaxID=1849041 RepID=UPI0033072325
MMKLVAATNNQKKLREISRILAPMGFGVLSLKDIGLEIEVEEDADSFAGNARLKAQAVFERCNLPTVADDSGLCVEALGGAPGVYSARYGGPGLNDQERTSRLLDEMKDAPEDKRGAKFVSAICCILDRSTMLECSGECRGSIGFAPAGEGGFGYDPVFLVDGKSYSELSAEEKDAISHRGRALRNLRELLRGYLND